MGLRVIPLLACVVLAALACPAAAAQGPPISLHPDNGHYFLFRGRPTVLRASGSTPAPASAPRGNSTPAAP